MVKIYYLPLYLSLVQFAGMSTEVCPLPDAANLQAASHVQFDQVMADLTQLEGEVKGMCEGGGVDMEVEGRGSWGGCGSMRGIMW